MHARHSTPRNDTPDGIPHYAKYTFHHSGSIAGKDFPLVGCARARLKAARLKPSELKFGCRWRLVLFQMFEVPPRYTDFARSTPSPAIPASSPNQCHACHCIPAAHVCVSPTALEVCSEWLNSPGRLGSDF